MQVVLFFAKEVRAVLLANALNRTRLAFEQLSKLFTTSRGHVQWANTLKMEESNLICGNSLVLSRFKVASLYSAFGLGIDEMPNRIPVGRKRYANDSLIQS